MDFSEGAPIPPGRNSDDWVGQVIADKYHVLDVLGRGGFGSVYLGEITPGMVGERLALKVLPEKVSDNHTVREQFLNEIRVGMKILDKYISKSATSARRRRTRAAAQRGDLQEVEKRLEWMLPTTDQQVSYHHAVTFHLAASNTGAKQVYLEARRLFMELKKKLTVFPPKLQADTLYRLGQCYLKLAKSDPHDLDSAIRELRSVRASSLESPDFFRDLIAAYSAAKRADDLATTTKELYLVEPTLEQCLHAAETNVAASRRQDAAEILRDGLQRFESENRSPIQDKILELETDQ